MKTNKLRIFKQSIFFIVFIISSGIIMSACNNEMVNNDPLNSKVEAQGATDTQAMNALSLAVTKSTNALMESLVKSNGNTDLAEQAYYDTFTEELSKVIPNYAQEVDSFSMQMSATTKAGESEIALNISPVIQIYQTKLQNLFNEGDANRFTYMQDSVEMIDAQAYASFLTSKLDDIKNQFSKETVTDNDTQAMSVAFLVVSSQINAIATTKGFFGSLFKAVKKAVNYTVSATVGCIYGAIWGAAFGFTMGGVMGLLTGAVSGAILGAGYGVLRARNTNYLCNPGLLDPTYFLNPSRHPAYYYHCN